MHACCVSAGEVHSQAVSSDGTFYGWGLGTDCTLGMQLTKNQLVPIAYPKMTAPASAMA